MIKKYSFTHDQFYNLKKYCNKKKIEFMKKISKKNINFHNIYIPLNIYKIFSSNKIKCVEAEKYYNDSLCIPIYFSLKKYVAKKIIKIINEFK